MSELQDIVTLKHVTKVYPGVTALNRVSLSFGAGEVHALMGENGAGKSTLIKVIAGAVAPEEGEILVNGRAYHAMTPKLSRSLGIEVIYQEYNLIDPLSAAENISLGSEHGRLVDYRGMEAKAQAIFDQFGIDIDPKTPVERLSSAQRQIVEIAKAVSKDVRFLIMDEPSAALTVSEVDCMMRIIRRLKEDGVTVLYISHRLDEVFEIADRVSIMRDGAYVGTRLVSEVTRSDLIGMMVGRSISISHPRRTHELGEVVLEVKNLCGNGDRDIHFQLHRGEVLGVSGLVGAGRTELAEMLYGLAKKTSGEILLHGRPLELKSSHAAIRNGIGLIPEDRKGSGCFLDMTILWNISINNLRNICRGVLVSRKREREDAEKYRKLMNIKTPSLLQMVRNLSGGNQQKVVIAKTLAANSDILIFDEPTRGIDVGAKREIYLLMNELTAQGKSIIMITSDMEELLGMSDRIVVLYEGRQTGIVPREKFAQEFVLALASGETPAGAEAV